MDIWTDISGEEEVLSITDKGGGDYLIKEKGRETEVRAIRLRADILQLFIGKKSYLARVEVKPGVCDVFLKGHHYTVSLDRGTKRGEGAGAHAASGVGPQIVASTIPGKVVEVKVAVGQQVVAGDGLVVIEAMKMENELPAPKAGVVKEIYVKKGQAVEAGEKLVILD